MKMFTRFQFILLNTSSLPWNVSNPATISTSSIPPFDTPFFLASPPVHLPLINYLFELLLILLIATLFLTVPIVILPLLHPFLTFDEIYLHIKSPIWLLEWLCQAHTKASTASRVSAQQSDLTPPPKSLFQEADFDHLSSYPLGPLSPLENVFTVSEPETYTKHNTKAGFNRPNTMNEDLSVLKSIIHGYGNSSCWS